METFTIEVKKKEKDEEFGFEDLEMFHQDCLGGRILISEAKDETEGRFFQLACQRCKMQIAVLIESGVQNEIIKTAIDGEKRNFGAGYFDFGFEEIEATVLQKS